MHFARLEGWVEERKCKPLAVRSGKKGEMRALWMGRRERRFARFLRGAYPGRGRGGGKKCLREDERWHPGGCGCAASQDARRMGARRRFLLESRDSELGLQ